MTTTTEFLTHNRVRLALHRLSGGDPAHGPLLLLHGLGEASPTVVPDWAAPWAGAVWALDFTGHGQSTVPVGGGYSAEMLLADADIALHHLEQATVVGRGVGGYIALLLAGARPDRVQGAVVCDGPGLWGGSTGPASSVFVVLPPSTTTPDPYALVDLAHDLRPRDYAAWFARRAIEQSKLDDPITVAAVVRPPWLDEIVTNVGVVESSLADAVTAYSDATRPR